MHRITARGVLGAAAGLALAAGLAACGSSPSTSTPATPSYQGPPSSGPLTVAVEGPLTGPQADTGQDMVRGAELAASAINQGGGVDGRQIKVVGADDKAEAADGPAVARQVLAERAAVVVGPFNSSVGVTALPVYKAAGLPIVRLTSATNTEGYGVTTQPMVTQIAPVEATEIHSVLQASSAAILYDPSTYTAGIAHQLAGLLSADGIHVVVNRSLNPDNSSDIGPSLKAVAQVHPAVTYLAMYGPQAGATVKAMAGTTGGAKASYGYCLVDLAAQGSTYTDAAGSASDTCLASGVPAPDQLPSATAGGYVQDYQARFHTTPGTWGPFVYDSVEIWAQAADKAKAVSGAPVRQNLLSTADYAGVTGTTTIVAPSGNRSDPPVVILDVSESGQYSVDASWAQAAGYHQS